MPDDSQVFDNKPELLTGLDFYFNAFDELKTERQLGMALGPIPWYSVVRWAEFHGLRNPDDVDVLLRYIRAMEGTQREHEDKEHDRRKY